MICERRLQTRMFSSDDLGILTAKVNDFINGRVASVEYWNFETAPKDFIACVHIVDVTNEEPEPVAMMDGTKVVMVEAS